MKNRETVKEGLRRDWERKSPSAKREVECDRDKDWCKIGERQMEGGV